MSNQLLHFRRALSKRQNNVQANWKAPLRKHRYKLILASLVAYFFIQKDLTINLRLSNKSDFTKSFISQNSVSSLSQNPSPLNTSLLGNAKEQKNRAKKDRNNLANTYSNMAYTRKEFATGDSSERLAEKEESKKSMFSNF